MKTIDLKVESYLFENEDGQFRLIPFYELSMEEIIIFQNDTPKYLIDFNYKDLSFNKQIREQIEQGLDLDSIIRKIGIYLGLEWSIKNKIKGSEISNSQRVENISVELIENFSDLAHELTFIATDYFILEELINDDTLFENYVNEDKNGFLGIEQLLLDRQENIKKLIDFLFFEPENPNYILDKDNVLIYDLTQIKDSCISHDDLEDKYQDWLRISSRDNSMDEYGNLLGLISFIDRNKNKKRLILRIEPKNTVPNNGYSK